MTKAKEAQTNTVKKEEAAAAKAAKAAQVAKKAKEAAAAAAEEERLRAVEAKLLRLRMANKNSNNGCLSCVVQ